jgi:hypothetical protein
MQTVIEISEELASELEAMAQSEHKMPAHYVIDLLWRDVRHNKQRHALELSAGAVSKITWSWLTEAKPTSIESDPNPMNARSLPSSTARLPDGSNSAGFVGYL